MTFTPTKTPLKTKHTRDGWEEEPDMEDAPAAYIIVNETATTRWIGDNDRTTQLKIAGIGTLAEENARFQFSVEPNVL